MLTMLTTIYLQAPAGEITATEWQLKDTLIRILSHMPDWIRNSFFLNNSLGRWLVALLLIGAGFAFRKVLARLIYFLFSFVRFQGEPLGRKLADIILIPVANLIPPAVCHVALTSVLVFPDAITIFIFRVTQSIIVVFFLILLYRLTLGLIKLLRRGRENLAEVLNETVFEFYGKLLRVGFFILGLISVLSVFGINVSGLLTGLGIGGLAISLAAKDSLTNLLSGLFIMSDQSIQIGHEVKCGDGTHGIVEKIGFRSSKIRTFDQTLVIIPNHILADQSLVNFSYMTGRRVRQILVLPDGMSLAELGEMEEVLKKYLQNREAIRSETILLMIDSIQEDGIHYLMQFMLNSSTFAVQAMEQDAALRLIWQELERLGHTIALSRIEISEVTS